MKRSRIVLLILMLGILCLACFNIALAFLQTAPSESAAAPVTNVPWELWIPFLIGFIGHWYKKYVEDKVLNSFLNYFATGILGSISAVVGGFISFVGLYAMNPSAYPLNAAGCIGVALISFTWDSLANGPKVDPTK